MAAQMHCNIAAEPQRSYQREKTETMPAQVSQSAVTDSSLGRRRPGTVWIGNRTGEGEREEALLSWEESEVVCSVSPWARRARKVRVTATSLFPLQLFMGVGTVVWTLLEVDTSGGAGAK